MELQLTEEAKSRIIDISNEAIAQMQLQVDEMLVGYPENHLIAARLAAEVMEDELRKLISNTSKWELRDNRGRRVSVVEAEKMLDKYIDE